MTEKDLVQIIDAASEKFKGQLDELESAIGMLMLSRLYGWKVIYLIHSRKTIQKYEKMLGVNLRELAPPVGRLAHKSLAWKLAQGVGNFWKAVRGEIPDIRTAEVSK
jgi:hypothetical protein